MRRPLATLAVLATALAAAAATSVPAAAAPDETSKRGDAAVRHLGDRLPAVAKAYGTDAATLKQRFSTDDALYVDEGDKLFYVDPASADPAGAQLTAPAPSGVDVGALHSRPGAKRTVLLDVDGFGGTFGGQVGGAWEDGYTGGDGVAEPYAHTGSDRAGEIYDIWSRVAEDFAAFDIDVTTEEPADPSVIDRSGLADDVYGTRVVLTSSDTTCGCGGVAYVGVFDQYGAGTGAHAHYQPAFVYNASAKAAAEAASHEAGHNLGLSHDGTRTTGYYAGHGAWAPIMGVGYDRPVSQWSRGEYSGATNKEDDFAVAGANGAPTAPDPAHAGVDPSAGEAAVAGTLSTRLDTDELTLTPTQTGTFTIKADPALVSPNLDLQLRLLSSSGTVLASSNPTSAFLTKDTASGLGAALTATLNGDSTYRVVVDGVGAGDPLTTGYSDYGSVGTYRITVVPGTPVTTTAPPATPSGLTATVRSDRSVLASWSDVVDETAYELRRETYKGGRWSLTASWSLGANVVQQTDAPGRGTHRYSLRAMNAAGASAWTSPVQVKV